MIARLICRLLGHKWRNWLHPWPGTGHSLCLRCWRTTDGLRERDVRRMYPRGMR
jgi:hypothetical protein